MVKKIFACIFLSVLFAVLIETGLITAFIYSNLASDANKSLESEAYAVARYIEQTEDPIDYLEIISTANHTSRYTWVSPEGVVLFDTDANPLDLENHINRTEIKKAMEEGSGSSIRYSDTLAKETRYAAERLSDGSVIRLAKDGNSAFLIAGKILTPFIVIMLLIMVISALVAIKMAHSKIGRAHV